MEIESTPAKKEAFRFWLVGVAAAVFFAGLIFILAVTAGTKKKYQPGPGDPPKEKEVIEAKVGPGASPPKVATKTQRNDDFPTQHPPIAPDGGEALKYMDERPPDKLSQYVEKYKEEPKKLLYVRPEMRYYSYSPSHHYRMYWYPDTKLWYAGNPK